MTELSIQRSIKNASALLLWKRGEEGGYLENVDVKILENGIVQLRVPAREEKLITHISNVVIVVGEKTP